MPFAIPLPEPSGLDEGKRSRRPRFWSIVSVAVSAVLYSWTWFLGRGFEELYHGFGSALPWLTRVALAAYEFSGLMFLVGLLPCVALMRAPVTSHSRRTRLLQLVRLGFALSWLWAIIFYTAMYLPVIQMGSPVR